MTTERVRPVKQESAATGGDANDDPEYLNAPGNPNEDALDVRGIYFQNDSSNNTTTIISRDASNNMTFTDAVAGTYTLSQLATIVATPTATTRALNTNFTPSATKATWVTYSVSISCSLSLAVGQTGTVELRSDTTATPTTVRATITHAQTGTLVVGLALTSAQTCQLTYLVPAGHNVRLVSSGTATITLISQTEVVLG